MLKLRLRGETDYAAADFSVGMRVRITVGVWDFRFFPVNSEGVVTGFTKHLKWITVLLDVPIDYIDRRTGVVVETLHDFDFAPCCLEPVACAWPRPRQCWSQNSGC